jgi:uncharacterized protein
VRALIFLIVSSTAHYLAARWILSVSPTARKQKRIVWAVAAALSVLLAIMRVLGWVIDSALFHNAMSVALVELSIIVIALLPIGIIKLGSMATAKAVDVVKPPANDEAKAARVSRREALELGVGASVVGVTGVALGWGIVRGRHAFELEEVVIKVPNWPRALDGYVIAQISDIHVGPFVGDRELDEGFEVVRRVRPDLLVATGDLVDSVPDAIGPLITRLLAVNARDGAHAILGNHDHYASADRVTRALAKSGVNLLDNGGVHLRPDDGGGFALLGVDDLEGLQRRTSSHRGPDLARALASIRPDLPRILLAHQPRFFDTARGRVAVQLSGHTHGGQINPGFRPARALMEYVAGRYERGGSTLWVNRGFGVVGPPARIGAPPEVTKIVLVSG